MQVPPMSREKTQAVIEQELNGMPIDSVFEWLELESVLGSASIAQASLIWFLCTAIFITTIKLLTPSKWPLVESLDAQ